MKCRHCACELVLPMLDLGSAPPSNAYLTPAGLQAPEGGTARYARSDELVAFLAKAQQNDAVRFKNWVQRDVYYPSGSARRTGDRPTSAVSKKVG